MLSKVKEAFKSINNDELPSDDLIEAMEQFADMFLSCTTKSPGGRIASEVNRHHHTRTCRKKNTNCRFGIPRLVSTRTILSIPAKILYPDEEERDKILSKFDKVMEKVKDCLENEELIKDLSEKIYGKEIEEFIKELEEIEGEENEQRFMDSKSDDIAKWREERIIELLKIADIAEDLDLSESVPDFENQLLEGYLSLLRVSKRDFGIVLVRDIDEGFINNFNEEWIRAWDSNMDIQITMTYFAIVTYVTDYHMKDDTGTMDFILAALKEAGNQPLRDGMILCKNQYLSNRQMGESEGYYRLIPSLHLADSNIATIFVHTGFQKSRFLKALTPEEVKRVDKSRLIQLEHNSEKYFIETPSIGDKYLRRPSCLEAITLSQFTKRYVPVSLKESDKEKEVNCVNKDLECPPTYGIKDNFIISPNVSERINLPYIIELDGDSLPGESKYLKLRKPIALRYHKYKEMTEPHEFFFSEMELYTPFRDYSELYPEDIEKCQELYNSRKSSLQYTKSRVMEFLEVVEEARVTAEEMLNEEIAIQLDAEANQDNAECELLGNQENESFITMDSESLQRTTDDANVATEGVYKRIEIQEEDILRERTDALDEDQKCVIDIGITYAKDILKFRTGKAPLPTSPLVVVQGSAGKVST